MRRAVYFDSGAGTGQKIVSDSLEEYAGVFGLEKTAAILKECNQDFLEI
jgi:hypothetical protein